MNFGVHEVMLTMNKGAVDRRVHCRAAQPRHRSASSLHGAGLLQAQGCWQAQGVSATITDLKPCVHCATVFLAFTAINTRAASRPAAARAGFLHSAQDMHVHRGESSENASKPRDLPFTPARGWGEACSSGSGDVNPRIA